MNDICNVSELLFTILYADDTCVLLSGKDLTKFIQIHSYVYCRHKSPYIQYTIKIFKLKCYNDFTLYLNTNHNQLTIIK